MNIPAEIETMVKVDPAPDVPQQLCELTPLGTSELRIAWRRYYRTPPPKRLSRDLLIRAIAYKIQERAFGGLAKSTLRSLATVTRSLETSAGLTLDVYRLETSKG